MKKRYLLALSMLTATVAGLALIGTGTLQVQGYDLLKHVRMVGEAGTNVLGGSAQITHLPDISSSGLGPNDHNAPRVETKPSKGGADSKQDDIAYEEKLDAEEMIQFKGEILPLVLNFLESSGDTTMESLESQLESFLEKELGMSTEESSIIIKKCFWKNFVTLQQNNPEMEKAELNSAFQEEVALKKAGFAALGLALIDSDILQAQALLQNILTTSVYPTEGGRTL